MKTIKLYIGAIALLGYGVTLATAFTGEGTWYNVNQHNAAGSCGKMHYDNEYVVAIAHGSYDKYPGATANPNDNPICGKNIKVTYEGKSVVVTVVDRCGDCENPNNIDMSPTAFDQLADRSKGRLYGVTWDYTSEPAGPVNGNGSGTGSGGTDSAGDDAPPKEKPNAVVSLGQRSTIHQGSDEPVSRDLSSAKVTPDVRRSSADDTSGTPATKRSLETSTFERRFHLSEPARLRRFHDAIQERDRKEGEGNQNTGSAGNVVARSKIPEGLRLRRMFSEVLKKREWLQKDHE